MKKPTVAFLPFSYPDYPRELVEEFIDDSKKMLNEIGLNVIEVKPVIEWKDSKSALRNLLKEDFDGIIATIVSWVEAPNVIAVLREFKDRPIILWSHTMFKRNGELLTLGAIPGAGVVKESLEEMGIKASFIWGMPWEEEVRKKLQLFSRAAYAKHRLNYSKIGLIGYASMGMYTGTFNHVSVRRDIGPEIEHLDQYMIIARMEKVRDSEAEELVDKMKKDWDISDDVSDNTLIIASKMYLALKELVREFGWNAFTVKCQYELSREFGFAPCIPLSMIADEIPCSCEGDVPLVITQLMMHYLSGGLPVSYGDIHLIAKDHILLGACGFAPFKLTQGRPKIRRHTALYQGLLNSAPYKKGKVTLARLAFSSEGYKMHIATGEADLPEPFHEVGCPPYPSMKVKLNDTHHFGQNLMSQHYAVVYGDLKEELLELCRLLDIKAVVS